MPQQKAKEQPPREEHDALQYFTPSLQLGRGDLHPFIRGLLETLPPPGAEWPSEKRRQWLDTAEHIFALIYKGNGDANNGQ